MPGVYLATEDGLPIKSTNPLPVTGATTTTLTGSTLADGASTSIANQGYNGTTYDRWRNNIEGTILASAARTVATTTPNQTNYNARGVIIFLNVTLASGTGGLTVRINGIDPVSGVVRGIPTAPTIVTAVGHYNYVVYPGASGGVVSAVSALILPRSWTLQVSVGDASSYTYSVGYSLIL